MEKSKPKIWKPQSNDAREFSLGIKYATYWISYIYSGAIDIKTVIYSSTKALLWIYANFVCINYRNKANKSITGLMVSLDWTNQYKHYHETALNVSKRSSYISFPEK